MHEGQGLHIGATDFHERATPGFRKGSHRLAKLKGVCIMEHQEYQTEGQVTELGPLYKGT